MYLSIFLLMRPACVADKNAKIRIFYPSKPLLFGHSQRAFFSCSPSNKSKIHLDLHPCSLQEPNQVLLQKGFDTIRSLSEEQKLSFLQMFRLIILLNKEVQVSFLSIYLMTKQNWRADKAEKNCFKTVEWIDSNQGSSLTIYLYVYWQRTSYVFWFKISPSGLRKWGNKLDQTITFSNK